MNLDLACLPYVFLWLSVVTILFFRQRTLPIISLTLAVGFGVWFHILEFIGVGALLIACVIAWIDKQGYKTPVLKYVPKVLLIVVSLAFLYHLVPDFHNLLVVSNIRLSPNALPYNMYLNFDKIAIAVIINLFLHLTSSTSLDLKSTSIQTFKVSVMCVITLITLAMLAGYIELDPKTPNALFWMWALNNLFFVCFAEETVFRGLIQTYLLDITKSFKYSNLVAIGCSALLFGAGHFKGGIAYIFLATIGGLFNGWIYYRTKRLGASMTVHFCLNAVHFLLFTYPAIAHS
jgi:membrane protease YdiL (CAAX protease family)